MSDYLLDTHAWLWWSDDSPRLPRTAFDIIKDPNSILYVSLVTAWEIAIKTGIGKLSDPGDIQPLLAQSGFLPLGIEFNHIERSKSLPLHHRDPFDRMLIAQALAEKLTLVSNETVFDRYGVTRVWE